MELDPTQGAPTAAAPATGDAAAPATPGAESLDDALRNFWREQTLAAEGNRATTEADFKAQNDLPLARVKRIMKSDSDVRMIAQEAPVILARACELLTLELTLRAAKDQEHAKLITRADIVKAAPTMDFLHGVVCPAQAPSQDEIAEAEGEYA